MEIGRLDGHTWTCPMCHTEDMPDSTFCFPPDVVNRLGGRHVYRRHLLCQLDKDIDRRPGDGEWVLFLRDGSCVSVEDLKIIISELEHRNRKDESNAVR